MKGLMQWFKASVKMKRWILLILVGIILACYGIAQILVYDVVDATLMAIGKIVVTFVVGFTCIVLGLIYLNKRTLEVLVESTDDRMSNRKNVNVKSLIFNKTVYDEGPNIVVIGGGSGLNTVLSGIKNYTKNIIVLEPPSTLPPPAMQTPPPRKKGSLLSVVYWGSAGANINRFFFLKDFQMASVFPCVL